MTLNNKTPEEILKENWHKVTDRPFGEMELQHLNYAIKAMQEYANQEKRKAFNEALELGYAFANWIQDKQYFRYWGSDGPNCGKWYKGYTMPDRSYCTTQELFKIFERETNKNK